MDFGCCLFFLALDVESSDQFTGWIDALGAFGPTCLAHFSSGPGAFHLLGLCHIRSFAAIGYIGHGTIFPGPAFTAPFQRDPTGAGVAPENKAVLGDEFLCSHDQPITNVRGWLPST